MGVAYIHFYPPPQEVQHRSSNKQLTFLSHFYSVYNKWRQDNSSCGHDDL